MIPLKSVKTLPITIERTDRLESDSTGPRALSLRSASAVESPRGWAAASMTPLI